MDLDKISPKLIGDKVILGRLRRELNDIYRHWLDRPENSFMPRPHLLLTFEQENEWFAMNEKSGDVNFTIYEKEHGKPIGVSGFAHIQSVNRDAEFGIYLGEETFKNKGFGTEAAILTIDYAYNERALRVYEKIGFRKIGVRRRAQFLGGQFIDDIYMDILPEDSKFSKITQMIHDLK